MCVCVCTYDVFSRTGNVHLFVYPVKTILLRAPGLGGSGSCLLIMDFLDRNISYVGGNATGDQHAQNSTTWLMQTRLDYGAL